MRSAAATIAALLFSLPLWGQSWQSLGPPGGDVHTLGHDPQHPSQLYLGTADGHIFGSADAGEHWLLLGRVSTRLDEVLTVILVDPRKSQTIYAAAWTRDSSKGGGVFRSDDGGLTWRDSGLAGQAVRALAQAPSNPDILVAGTLEGVFLTRDAGVSWQRISPASSAELRNLDALAFDPRQPNTIYAGTFHLPWKTVDGGRTWMLAHTGMIDDSDVMSILIDRSDPRRVYASACSGIYRSENSAALWQKMQGIPYSARRTNVITQDQIHPEAVYAGTTEGLWKSDNSGSAWRRTTPPDWVINAVELPADHPRRVVLGTEELGILVSDDGGEHFHSSNDGFNHRQTAAVAFDPDRPGRILAVFAHAPESILATENNGRTWTSLGPGLATRQLKRLFASPDGWWATLQAGGLLHYDHERSAWMSAGTFAGIEVPEPRAHATSSNKVRSARPAARKRAPEPAAPVATAPVVNDMAFSGDRWFAATEVGLFVSTDRGQDWQPLALGPMTNLPVSSVRASGNGRRLWVVSLRGLVFSADSGHTWTWHDLPLESGGALRVDLAPGTEGQTLVVEAHSGLFISRDAGRTWQRVASGLPEAPVEDLTMVGSVFVASLRVGGLYASLDAGRTWNRLPGTLAEGFFPVVAAENGRILAASASDGIYSFEWAPLVSATPSQDSQAVAP